jgi:pimeloyl-ACP methyl ester carboxylesterase
VFEQLMVEQDFPQGLTFSRIPQAGHFLHQEQPEQVSQKIVEWLTLNDELLAIHA